ncbi:hypothetical protein GPALN_011342 [Globodera pallida]|nr:hypothetical protein GPALN_011342 [Globodera pallida]
MSCASPSSQSSTIFTNSTTHLPAIRHEPQQQFPSTAVLNNNRNNRNNRNNSSSSKSVHHPPSMRPQQHKHSRSSSTLTVREVPKASERADSGRRKQPEVGAVAVLPPPVYSSQLVPAAAPYCWSSTSSSPSLAGLGKRRSSWSNLVHASEISHLPSPSVPISALPSVHHAPYPSAPGACGGGGSRPPSYGEIVAAGNCQNIRHSHTTASRQTSNASSSARSGEVFAGSKGSFFRFVGPPAPFPAAAGRSASAQSSAAGGRVSAAFSLGPRRPLQPQNSTEPNNLPKTKKRDRMQDLRELWAKTGCKLCCLALLITLIGLVVATAILAETFVAPKSADFAWLPPDQFRAGGQPNRVTMRAGELGEQVRFELTGAPPFKSNFVTVFDFKTNKVAHLDRSLRSASAGHQSVCFVLDLDRQQAHSSDELQRAAKAGAEKNRQLHGWEEDWHFMPNPVSGAAKLFQPDILECQGARWIELIRTPIDQKGQRCSECFDFCLPDWGVERDAIRDEQYLNVLRRVCFHLFVPEWRTFAQSFSTQQNQHDFEEFYRRQQQQQMANPNNPNQQQQQQVGAVSGGGTMETKWVALQTPQTPQNQQPNVSAFFPSLSSGGQSVLSGLGQVGSGIGQLGQGVGQHLFGTGGAVPSRQGQQMPPFGANGVQSPQSIVPQLSVHSQFSPSELNGPAPPQPQPQQQQFPAHTPPFPSLWNEWSNGAGLVSPPVESTGGVGAVSGVQPPHQQQTVGGQQQSQPTFFGQSPQQQQLADVEQHHQQSLTPSVQVQRQQVWVGRR